MMPMARNLLTEAFVANGREDASRTVPGYADELDIVKRVMMRTRRLPMLWQRKNRQEDHSKPIIKVFLREGLKHGCYLSMPIT